MMFDVDHFKKVNDVHGHQAGDHVLRIVAETMKACFRRTDVICRYGGEEFLVILNGTDLKGSVFAAEKFRQTIATTAIIFDGKQIPVTISGGLAQVKLGEETTTAAIARADAALYQSKESGRNQVSIHDGEAMRKA